MPCMHQGTGCNSPCNPGPAQAVLAACPGGIPAHLLPPGHRASLRSRMAAVRCLSKTAVWSLQREAHLQTKQWLIGWMLGKKDWSRNALVLRACYLSRKAVTPGCARAWVCWAPTHTQPTYPGRIGGMTGVCNVHAHVHAKIAPRWQVCWCRTTNTAMKNPSRIKYSNHDLWETLTLFAPSSSRSESSIDQGVSGHDVSKCLSSNTSVIQVNAGGEFHCLKLGRYWNNFLN